MIIFPRVSRVYKYLYSSSEGHQSLVALIHLGDLHSHFHTLLTETYPVKLQSCVRQQTNRTPLHVHTYAGHAFTSLHTSVKHTFSIFQSNTHLFMFCILPFSLTHMLQLQLFTYSCCPLVL